VTCFVRYGIELRFGRWQDVLADVTADALISDPPYGQSTHEGHNAGAQQVRSVTGQATRTAVSYIHWTPGDATLFVESWAPRIFGWMAIFTSDDLAQHIKQAYRQNKRYEFRPIPVIQKRPRLLGDGPACWSVDLVVSRPRKRSFATWGCLPGAYEAPCEKGAGIAGTKPLGLMRAIIRDYTRPGDLVVDPCAGGGTTLLAAAMEGRRAIGAECMREHYDIAVKRLSRGFTPTMFAEQPKPAEQVGLFGADDGNGD